MSRLTDNETETMLDFVALKRMDRVAKKENMSVS